MKSDSGRGPPGSPKAARRAGPPISVTRRIEGVGFKGFGVRVWGFRFGASGLGRRVKDVGFRVSQRGVLSFGVQGVVGSATSRKK